MMNYFELPEELGNELIGFILRTTREQSDLIKSLQKLKKVQKDNDDIAQNPTIGGTD